MLYESELRRYYKYFSNIYKPKVDYNYKSYVLSNNINTQVNKIKWCSHLNFLSNITGEFFQYSYPDDTLDIWYNSLADRFGFLSILEAMRLNNARYHRVGRLKRRVASIISYRSFFLTLTFTNVTLLSTSAETRRRYVARYLKSISQDYVANVDYGERNHREHYHAIVRCDEIDYKLWKYGNLDFELITFEDETAIDRLSKYIAKLTNHAIKETAKRGHLIYPKYRRIYEKL
jgi:hypothetical protein